MKRSPSASLAHINKEINKLKPMIAQIVEFSDPDALHEILLRLLSRPLLYSDLYHKGKLQGIEPDVLHAEQELLNDYNEYKQMLLQILRRGYRLTDILKMLEASRSIDKAIGTEIKPSANQDLAVDFDFVEGLGGSFSTIYVLWMLYEIITECKGRTFSRAEELNDRGYECAQWGDYHQAVLLHKQAIELSPNFHLAWVNAGIALKNLGSYLGAIEMYDYVIENIDRDYKKAWHNKAVALQLLGRTDEAIECCKVALEIDPFYDKSVQLRMELETNSELTHSASPKTKKVLLMGTYPELYVGLVDLPYQTGSTSDIAEFEYSQAGNTVVGPLDFASRRPYISQILGIASSLDWSTSSTQRVVETIKAFLEEAFWDPPVHPFVALANNALGGFAFVSKTRKNKKWWELHFIGVDRTKQRTGLGYLLLSSIYKYMKASGGDSIIMAVNPYAKVAIKFFEQSASRMSVRLINSGVVDGLVRLRMTD